MSDPTTQRASAESTEPLLAEHARIARTAADLMQPVSPVASTASNDCVRELFARQADLNLVAVIEQDRPIGTIQRHTFMETYARPFARDLFGKKSCAALMRGSPLVVDPALPIAELARLAVARGRQVLEGGFVVAEDGRYLGVGEGSALVAALSSLEQERARQLEESVRYASTIQRAMLAGSATLLAHVLPDSALLWEPRELVGGDCYCFREVPSGLAGAVLDCTGHGVPGAFMTCIAYAALEQALADATVAEHPGEVLGHLDRSIKATLRHGAAESADDGLDGLVFHLSRDRGELRVASARVPAFVRSGRAVEPVPTDRISVGNADTPDDHVWRTSVLPLAGDALVAIATDGFVDQLGGPRRIAFGKRQLADVLAATSGLPAAETARVFREAHEAWRGAEPRRDDATLLAFTTRIAP